MIKKLFITSVLIAFVYGFYYWFTLSYIYVDSENNCNIEIEQSFTYKKSEVIKAIEFLKDNSSEHYGKMCAYVKGINSGSRCPNSPNGRVFGCAHLGDKIGFKPLPDSSTEELASILVHEVCHFHQGNTATPESYQEPYFSSHNPEPECYEKQNSFLEKVSSAMRYP